MGLIFNGSFMKQSIVFILSLFISGYIFAQNITTVSPGEEITSIKINEVISQSNTNAAKKKFGFKELPSNVTINTTLGALSFTSLEVGKWYRVSGQFTMGSSSGNGGSMKILVYNTGGSLLSEMIWDPSGTDQANKMLYVNLEFKALTTDLDFVTENFGSNRYVVGAAGSKKTFVTVREIDAPDETTPLN